MDEQAELEDYELEEEAKQIAAFAGEAARLETYAREHGYSYTYHIFGNHWDTWRMDAGEAIQRYQQARADGEDDVRLYIQFYDEEHETDAGEDCLITHGGLPT